MRRMAPVGALLACLSGCVMPPMGPMAEDTRAADPSGVVAQREESGVGVERGVLKGRVVSSAGRPVAGAQVVADNQLLYNSNLIVTTDTDGHYRVETDVAATFHATASLQVERDGVAYQVELRPEDDSPFAGPEGAIRNFTWKLSGAKPDGLGHYGGSVLFYLDGTDPGDPETFLQDEGVELTLTPQSPLLDGSPGEVITRRAARTPDGSGLLDVPIARYRVSATHEGRPLQVRLRGSDAYAAEIVADFSQHINSVYWIQLELKL
ncbi:carboxypeptidase-like regulatory domain-containing protein [Nonomuraea sp. MCN248]|uniref:Carboxypeptidase-like regulatory domain-containing protein n=1 Tax=Nonomuraea corallina TaxID=2989783 RepID=A0ABT4SNJ6_9ACTN|nr:carboxypeptidase-like regulatory domain-containing protein [Nonomuraea corallina]MDA0638510.1 carboxypeptidase-like regulatory domain-containing protein [Nonomuraea corallina]